jgi:hypothetical protein
MALPQQERDGAAHGVPRDKGSADSEQLEQGRGIVGAFLQTKRQLGPDAPPVAPVVEGKEAVVDGRSGIGGKPGRVCRRRPAVEQEHGERVRRPVVLAEEGLTPAWEKEHTP